MLTWFQQCRDLPALNIERLQDFDELVNNQISLLANQIHRVVAVGKIDRRSVSYQLIGRQVLAEAKVHPEGVEGAADFL